jgi:cation:H+ antiporter
MGVVVGAGMLLIVLSADYFTNGIEWLGHRLGLGETAVGTLLAALGTALPETLVPVMALVATGRPASTSSDGVGLGAILGAPLMLSTLGFFVLGSARWWFRHRAAEPDAWFQLVRRDLTFFLVAVGVSLVGTGLPASWHRGIALLLVALYALFAMRVLRAGASESASGSLDNPLHLWHHPRPPTAIIVLQVAMALLGLVVGAHFFVEAVTALARSAHMEPFVLSVVLTPLATELPEVLNSVIWMRRGAYALAFGNVTGALAFQASLVPALGLWFTPWRLTPVELGVAVTAVLGAAWMLLVAVRRVRGHWPFFLAGAGYLAFLAMVLGPGVR